jgi:hypothetical protein
MKRVIVLGGRGHFGRTIVAELKKLGVLAMAASRRGDADLCCDAESASSLRATLRAGDLVIDAAGPFHLRTTTFIETAVNIGCDVIDINDNLGYAQQVLALESRINTSGIRVLTSASTVSAVAAAMIAESRIDAPIRLSAYLAPATRYTANTGAALSLLRSVGQPIEVWRDGRLQAATGWTDPRVFDLPPPVGRVHARLYESADAVHLPRQWPTLREVTMHVDSRLIGVNSLLAVAARCEPVRRLLSASVRVGAAAARFTGTKAGGVGYEIQDADGRLVACSLIAQERGYLTAVAPAVLAARAIVDGDFRHRGLIPPREVCEPMALFGYLQAAGVEEIVESSCC